MGCGKIYAGLISQLAEIVGVGFVFSRFWKTKHGDIPKHQ